MAGIGDRMSGENGIMFRDGFPITSPALLPASRTARRDEAARSAEGGAAL